MRSSRRISSAPVLRALVRRIATLPSFAAHLVRRFIEISYNPLF